MSSSIKWINGSTTLSPIKFIAKIGNSLYDLNHFDSTNFNEEVLELDSLELALNLSISLYTPISFLELSNIGKLVHDNNLDYRKVDIFALRDIRTDKNFNTILAINNFPESIRKYLMLKTLPLKSIELITTFSKSLQEFLNGFFISNISISYQKAKIFIDNIAIQKEALESVKFVDGFEFDDRKTSTHIDIDNSLIAINSKVFPISISTDDNFESGKLKISFYVDKANSYDKFIDILNSNDKDIRTLIEFLKGHDLGL